MGLAVVEGKAKQCPKCKEFKMLDAFGINNRDKLGRNSYCKPCGTEKATEWNKNNKQRRYEISRKHRSGGVTEEEWNEQYARQLGKCAICSEELPEKPHTDHSHDTGKFRGILCRSCNIGLGHFQDDPTRLRSAAEYLDKHNKEN